MSAYEELRKRFSGNNSQGNSENKGNSEKGGSDKSAYEELKQRYQQKRIEQDVGKVDDAYIHSYLQAATDYFGTAGDDYANVGWNNAETMYQRRKDTKSDLDYRHKVISSWLDANKDTVDKYTYTQLSNSLSAYSMNASNVLDSFSERRGYFSQWSSEEAYNNWVAQQNRDIDAEIEDARKQIAELEAKQKEEQKPKGPGEGGGTTYLPGGTPGATGMPYGAALQQKQQDENHSGTGQELLDARRRLVLLERAQKKQALGSVTENEDFGQYSSYQDGEDPLHAYINATPEEQTAMKKKYGNTSGDGKTTTYLHGGNQTSTGMAAAAQQDPASQPKQEHDSELFAAFGRNYDLMTPEEIAKYNYHYNKHGKQQALEYLDTLQDDLNKRRAEIIFGNVKDERGQELIYQLGAGVHDFAFGLDNAFNFSDDYIATPAHQYASAMVREDLADFGPKIGDYSLGQISGDLLHTTGNMLPSMLVNYIAPGAGTVTMGVSAAGNAYQSMLNEGYSKGQARAYGTLVGLCEVGMEKVLNGIPQLGKGMLPEKALQNLAKLDNALGKFAKSRTGQIVASMISEGTEEGLQEIMEPLIKSAITSEEMDIDWDNVVYSTFLGGMSGGIFEGIPATVNAIVQNAGYINTGKTINSTDGGVDALRKLANEMAGVSSEDMQNAITKQTGKMDKKATNRRVGKLFDTVNTANNLNNASANQADIAKSLQRKGFTTEKANAVAEALVASYNGQNLTSAQQKLLESVKDNADVKKTIEDIMYNSESTMGQRSQNIRTFENDIRAGVISKKAGISMNEARNIVEGKTVPQEESLSENSYEVSEDGKTIDKDGNLVSIQGVASIENGRMVLQTEGGTVDAKDVIYGNRSEALVYEAVANLGDIIDTETANKLAEHLMKLGETSSEGYVQGIVEAYRCGYYGYSRDKMTGEEAMAATLTEKQRNVAYGRGEWYRDAQTKAEQAKKTAEKKGSSKKDDGVFFQNDKGEVVSYDESGVKTDAKRESGVQTAKVLKKLGLGGRFVFFASHKNADGKWVYTDTDGNVVEAPNGIYYKDGTIYVDLNAGKGGAGLTLFTLSHELTHFIQQWSPAKYKALADFLIREYEKTGMDVDALVHAKQQDLSKKRVKEVSYDEAFHEMVADSMEKMFADGNLVQKLMKLKAQDNSLFGKIKGFVDKLARKIRWYYGSLNPDSFEGRMVGQMSDAIGEIQDKFAEALVEASENYQAAEKNTTEDGGVQMMVKENVVDVKGRTYKKVVKPGLTVYQSVKHKKSDYISYLHKKIFKRQFTVYDNNGEEVRIEFAKTGEIVKKDGTKNYRPALGELEATSDRLKMIAIINIKDLIKNSSPLDPSSENSHQWLDAGGWRDRIAYMMDHDVIYPVILHISQTRDGRHLLYDVSVIKNEGSTVDIDATALTAQSTRASATQETGLQSAVKSIEPSGGMVTQPEAKVNPKSLTPGEEGADYEQKDEPVGHSGSNNGRRTVGSRNAYTESIEALDVEVDSDTESVAPAVLMSDRTWNESDYVQEREKAATEIAKAIGVSKKKAKAYIDSVNSIAKMIANDRVRLDYFSSPGRSSFVGNVEYGGSFDFSTLCKKRRLLTGTFTAIQKALPNTALTADEILDIRNRMREKGLEVSCGLCYVEGSRANMGQFAKEFIKLYKQYYPDAWQPNMADVNTPDGIEWVRINHPECYEQYEYFWNHYGTLKPGDKNLFASQQKPKLYQLHTEYKGEILQKFKDDDNVEAKNLNGGIRLQSFSDFEIVHLIDTMQIIMDMSRVGLAGQAYTKVPDFAWALGDTGLKINLSLIAKGVDESGKLIFDDVEGMPIAEAMKLRERYSKNVGTILVAFNDAQLMAAMADERVDFIIPFHRSQWKKSQYEAMGLPAKTKDYTYMQNEKFIKPQYHEYRGRMVKDKATNYMPNEYWDFSKSGKENAVAYLEMCARNNKRPKFYKLLQNNGDGSYSLKADGSTDGYWKLLIDFKMYDNDGMGSPQMPVKPEFNMDEATRMMEDYQGGHSNFPVAHGIVDEFVKEYKDSHKSAMYSDRATESVTNRSLLANAFEGVVQNDIERKRLQEYKSKIDLINAEEQKLRKLNEQIKELSFAKGPRDTKAIRDLQDEATKTANRINIYDTQLLRLEASKPLQNVLERETKKAYQRAEKKGKEALEAYREKAVQTQREMLDRWQESRKKGVEGRHKTAMRHKIQTFKKRLESSLLKPTDRRYVPIDLIKAMVEVCDLIDTDTELYKDDGSINKAQEKRNLTKEKLQNLRDEYEKLKTPSDPIYAGEFDEMVYTYLTELRDKYAGKNLKEMNLDELTEMYEILRSIEETLQDARKLIGWGDAENVYEAGDAIVDEQNQITQSRKGGKRNAAQIARDKSLNLSLSPVRNVERMSGYNQDSYLLKMFKKIEQGIRKKNKFRMEAYKSFEELTSGKEYDDAIYKEVGGKKYTDVKGRKFGVSKMQMMQAILSYERENANNLHHIENGGFTFADLDMLRKGNLRNAISAEYSHRVPAAVKLVAEFTEALKNDQWCQDYMAAARKFFNGMAKDAINETSIALKHRIIAKDKNYIPFEVDRNFINLEISAEQKIQQTISSYGMLKDTKDNAPQALIVTGLNNVIDRHIDLVGNVYGLAIEIRNYNKVWNARSRDTVGYDLTVKEVIETNWGKEGVEHIEQAVQDVQGPRRSEQSELYKKVKSGYISATFLLNLSVVTKQIGSLFSATSMLKWRGPIRQIGNLLYTMANHKKISAEVDKYTATAWMRRQGLSDAELHTFMTEGKKTWIGRVVGKLPAVANPGKWITAMDSAVALSLWRYAKIDTAKRTGLKGEELLKATAEFYDEIIENTQSMNDVLHRPEIQKRSDILSESLGMFKTDLYQMAGQLQVTAGRFAANKTKANGMALVRTVYSVAMSAVWGQLMTTVFALLRYKVNQYRDDEDKELTYESWLKRQGFGFAGDLLGYIFPLFGSETIGFFEHIMYGESEEIVDSLALTALNDLYDMMITVGTSVKDGEMPKPEDMKKLTIKALQCFGIPANNIIRTYEAIHLHAKDIANGEFLSFEAGVDRSPNHHIHRIVEAMGEGKPDVALGLYEEALEETAMGMTEDGSYSEKELKDAKTSLKTALGNKFKDGEISEEQAVDILVKCFGLDKDDAKQDVGEWAFKVKYGVAWSDRSYAYVEGKITRSELKAAIMDLEDKTEEEADAYIDDLDFETSNGFAYDECKQMFLNGEISAAEAKSYIMTVDEKTSEEAEERVKEWTFRKEYGFEYSDRSKVYKSGAISKHELKKILIDFGGKTKEEADLQIQAYDWEVQGYEGVTPAAVREYNNYCATVRVPKDVYLQIRKFANNTENDVDEVTGKTINYSAMKKIMAEIGKQTGLTDAQKDAIARSLGWKEKNIKKYKTW